MKILHLIEELGGGGKERRLVELLKGLSKDADFEIHLVLTKTSNYYPEVNLLPIKIHQLNGFSNIAIIRQYFLLLKKVKPNIVHSWSFKTSFYISILKPLFSFKFIVGFIGDTFGFSKLKAIVGKQIIFRNADIIVSNSQIGLNAYKVVKNKGKVIHNGFDPIRISKNETNNLQELGVITPLNIVMLANVTPYKNYQLFIDIAEHFVNQRYDITFISIGKIQPAFEKLTKPYADNKHPKIKFLGFKDDVNELIKHCDIGLLCTYTEGISNSIMELMANGVPVITNDLNGASKEIISNGINGFICKNEEMIDKIQQLISNKSLRSMFSQNASNRIAEDYSLKKMVSNYIHIYLN